MNLSRLLPTFVVALAGVSACGRIAETEQAPGPTPGDAAPQACTPGQSIACGGPDGCVGYQICSSDGAHYDACVCPAPEADAAAPDAADAAPPTPEALYGKACKAPDGPQLAIPPADVPAALAGRWWLCGGAAEFYFPVEFTVDGRWYELSWVGGAFVRNQGTITSGTYTVDTPAAGGSFSIHGAFSGDTSFVQYAILASMQGPSGKLRLGGGDYVRIAP